MIQQILNAKGLQLKRGYGLARGMDLPLQVPNFEPILLLLFSDLGQFNKN